LPVLLLLYPTKRGLRRGGGADVLRAATLVKRTVTEIAFVIIAVNLESVRAAQVQSVRAAADIVDIQSKDGVAWVERDRDRVGRGVNDVPIGEDPGTSASSVPVGEVALQPLPLLQLPLVSASCRYSPLAADANEYSENGAAAIAKASSLFRLLHRMVIDARIWSPILLTRAIKKMRIEVSRAGLNYE